MPRFDTYYRRLSQPSRSSPIKREPKETTTLSQMGDDMRRSTRSRRVTRKTDEINPTFVLSLCFVLFCLL